MLSRKPRPQSSHDIDQVLQHLIARGDDVGIHLEAALGDN